MEVNQALFDYAKKTQQFPYFATKGQLSFALRREYAEAGARVIATGNYGHIINLAGDPKTYREIALATQKALETYLDIKEVEMSEFIPDLVLSGISQNLAAMSEGYQEYTLKGNNGEDTADNSEFEKVLGHPLTDLASAIKELTN